MAHGAIAAGVFPSLGGREAHQTHVSLGPQYGAVAASVTTSCTTRVLAAMVLICAAGCALVVLVPRGAPAAMLGPVKAHAHGDGREVMQIFVRLNERTITLTVRRDEDVAQVRARLATVRDFLPI